MQRVTRAAASKAKRLLKEQTTTQTKKQKSPRPRKNEANARAVQNGSKQEFKNLATGSTRIVGKSRTLSVAKNKAKKASPNNAVSGSASESKKKSIERKKEKKPVSKAKSPQTRDYTFKPPSDWKRHYELMILLREDRNAPVDSMGAEALPEKEHGDKVFRYQVLIALMLSSQTKDQMVSTAMKRLQKHGLTPQKIIKTSDKKLGELIYGVGFHNKKVTYIKKSTEVILERFGGDIPNTAEDMIRLLPGVGPKMAFLVENHAFDRPSGIGVDTHVLRFCNQLGWANSKNAEIVRKQLESWLPKNEWIRINLIMVGLGQHIQQPGEKEKMLQRLERLNEKDKTEAEKLLKKLGMKI